MANVAYSRFYTFLLHRWWLALILLGLSFAVGGLLTLNLLYTLSANFSFLSMYGVDAVRDGGLMQLAGAVLQWYAAAACYVLFKVCEKVLVELLSIDKDMDGES